jgi:heme/copper-type cytochrome/quinol oxidase subunit 4
MIKLTKFKADYLDIKFTGKEQDNLIYLSWENYVNDHLKDKTDKGFTLINIVFSMIICLSFLGAMILLWQSKYDQTIRIKLIVSSAVLFIIVMGYLLCEANKLKNLRKKISNNFKTNIKQTYDHMWKNQQ